MSFEPDAAVTSASPVRAALSLDEYPGTRPLVSDLTTHFDRVAALFTGDPARPEAWRAVIAAVTEIPRDRAGLAGVLGAQLLSREAGQAARAAAARLADPSAVAIVTGQQAGLFGGPLYTLLKTVTAIQLARRIEREHGVPAVPVFWVDAEDHDWEEVRECSVLDAEMRHVRIALSDLPGAGSIPVARIALDSSIADALASLRAALAPTEFTHELLASLEQAYRPGRGMAEAFARWIEGVFDGHGLVVFDAADPAAKRLAADVFARELEHPGRTSRLAYEAGERMRALGHEPQVTPSEGAPAIFKLTPQRRPVRWDDGVYTVDSARSEPAALVREAGEHPERFSPNVLLRPIVQDCLFPTVGYVAGPSELAYLAQLKEVYPAFGLQAPLLYPRAMATVLDSASIRFLARYDVPIASLAANDESALNRLLDQQLPASVERALEEAVEAVGGRMAAVIASMPAIDPTLAGAAETTLHRMQHDLRNLHTKIIHASKKKHDTLHRQFTRTQAQAFPGGNPQERTLAIAFFLNRYGMGMVDRLLAGLPLETGKHWILTP